MRSRELESKFPKLRVSRYEVTSPKDVTYNCIAWAAGEHARCWWPVSHPRYYWPENVGDASLAGFVRTFHAQGYEVCEGADCEPGFEKVAIYVGESLPTHMARQLPSGQWTSKCGDLEDITHTLEGLEGSIYGEIAVFMKRGRAAGSD